MTVRNWIKFFINSLLIGGTITGLMSLIIRWDDFYSSFYTNGEWGEMFAGFLWFVALGFTMSVVAQTGYFAYLTIHQIGVNLFRSLTLWNWVQLLLIVITIVDLIIFRFKPYASNFGDWVFYLGLLIILIGVSVFTAFQKVKLTGKKHVFISALFFMIVVSTLEWLIGLWIRTEGGDAYIALLLFPILAVNMYQLLVLPKYNAKSDEDIAKRAERRKARKEAEMKLNTK